MSCSRVLKYGTIGWTISISDNTKLCYRMNLKHMHMLTTGEFLINGTGDLQRIFGSDGRDKKRIKRSLHRQKCFNLPE